MNVVFLSPHFPPNWYHFVVALREAGATTLGIADANFDQLRPELRDALHDYYRVDSLESYDELVRALGYFIHRHGRIDRLDSLNEHWLEAEASLRTDFNIPGIDTRGIAAIKRKSLMKRRFIAAGLEPARGEVCRTPQALRRFIDRVGYPVVAKPDVGVGAAKTYKLENDADLERYQADKLPVDYIVEEFIDAEILTYDGLVDRAGEVVFDSSLVYSTGVMESVNEARDLYHWIPRQVPEDVREAGQKMARAFDLRERSFHFEMFRTADRGLVPLEVNMRPPGGLTSTCSTSPTTSTSTASGRTCSSTAASRRSSAARTRACTCARRDHRAYVLSHEDVLREYSHLLVNETRMDSVFSAAIGDHGFILRSPDLEPLLEAAKRIQAHPE